MLGIGVNLRTLRSSVAASAISAYYAGGIKPGLVFDFENEKYFTDSLATTFDSAITHSRSGNATMVDSDGLLKWAPHNLLTYSEQFDNAAWVKGNITITANAAIAPDGTTTADKIVSNTSSNVVVIATESVPVTSGQKYTISFFAKASEKDWVRFGAGNSPFGAGDYTTDRSVYFNLAGGVVGTIGSTFDSASILSVGSGWYLCICVGTATSTTTMNYDISPAHADLDADYSGTGDGIYIWGAHLYRSDLGGMVDNPDRGDSYVPTTSAARYLPRRGHHVYNGTSWVNEGVLHESEARTNLAPTSNTITGYALAGVSLSSGVALSPSGLTDASQATSDGGATNHGFGTPQISYVSGTTYVNSFFLKAGTETWVQITSPSTLSNDIWANFNLQDGTVGNTGASVAGTFVESYGNGWYRCSISYSAPTSASTLGTVVYMLNGTDAGSRAPTFTNSGRTFFFYQEDINAAATPSSPSPTSGSTVTRAADTLTVPSANLPWPTPNVIGEELVTNGTFDTDTDWTKGTGVTISGGVVNATAAAAIIEQETSLVSGRVYQATFDYTETTSLRLRIEGSGVLTASDSISGTGSGSLSLVFVANDPTFKIAADGDVFTGTIDNVSVREIDPLAVSIQMDGRMTYADEGSVFNNYFLRWRLDSGNLIQHTLNTASVNTGRVVFTQVQTFQDDVGSATTAYSPGVNVPFNIASRHGSTFVNGAVDGTALTADTTPTALPDLSTTDLSLAYDYMGTIRKFRVWAADIGDAGIAEAST